MLERKPSISLILPTYNQADFLRETLESIFNQTCSDFELIIVNDGSTDETPQILEPYTRLPFCTVISQSNQQLPSALNRGFSQARGEYLTWASSDNLLHPNMLSVLKEALEANPEMGLVYADWHLIDKDGKILREVRTPEFDRLLLMRINYVNACFMYRRECQERFGLYNPEYLFVEDWEYWWRLTHAYKMMRVPEFLLDYRSHEKNLTNVKVHSQKKSISIGYKKLAKDFRARPFEWYFSKLKWEWLRLKLSQDPKIYYQP